MCGFQGLQWREHLKGVRAGTKAEFAAAGWKVLAVLPFVDVVYSRSMAQQLKLRVSTGAAAPVAKSMS